MDSVTPADRRAAQRRVGAAAGLLFVLLLLLGFAAHGPAEASPAAPAAPPAPTAVPGEVAPTSATAGFPHHGRDGDGGPPDFGGGAAPRPGAGAGQRHGDEHDVSVPAASLAVAIALVLAAGVARVLVLTDDGALRRTARLYLEPLCTWCLIAVVVHGVAMGATGTVSVAGIALCS